MTGWWFSMAAGAAVKSTLVLLLAWMAALCLRRRSAAARHLVWTAAAAAIVALPLLSLWMPPLSVPTPAAFPASLVFRVTAASDAAAGAAARASSAGAFDWRAVPLLLWAAGILAACLRTVLAWADIARLRRAAALWPDAGCARELAAALGLRRGVRILETPPGSMPMTAGVWRPVVLLPSEAARWSEERRRMVLLHELAHVKRADTAMQLLARMAWTLHWWNPLAWLAWREFLKERERAADDLVLQTGARASDYAGHLLEVARAMHTAPPLAWAHVAMARPSQLEGRLAAILDTDLNRKAAGWTAALAALTAALLLAAPLAAVRAQSPPDLIALGQALIRQQQYGQAVANFEWAQRLDPARRAQAQMWIAVTRENQGAPAAAEAMYKSALAAAPAGSTEAATIARMYALFLRRQGRAADAPRLSATARRPIAATPGVFRVGGAVSPPKLLVKREPAYAEEARLARLQGTVVLYIEVGADGLAHNVQITQGLGLGLDDRAAAAVKQWRFQPGMKDGVAVPVAATVEVNFRLL